MSNFLAIAAATRTLAQLLDAPLTRDVPGAHVVTVRPDLATGDDADPETRLFLYRVEPSAAWRASGLPGRSAEGRILERPQVGLTLNYLLSFVGNEARLEPQRMLGSVIGTLIAHPVLARADIEAMVAAALVEDAQHPLALTDLAQQPDIVRVNQLPLSQDDLFSLWSGLFEAPYRLSVAYEASIVVITADETPVRALPVRTRNLVAATILRPAISRVEAVAGPLAPIQAGTAVAITGNQLRGEGTTVVAFGGVEVTPDPGSVSGNRIEVTVPATVRSGVTGVRVVHRRAMGRPPIQRLAGQSAPHPMVVQPLLLPLAVGAVHDVVVDAETGQRSGRIAVALAPPVGRTQQVTLILNAVPGGRSHVFEAERRDRAGDPEQTANLDLAFSGVAAGIYLLRVTVDGAETPLAVDATPGGPTEGQYNGPTVVVP